MNWKSLVPLALACTAALCHSRAETILFRNASIYPVSSEPLEKADLLIVDGKIKQIGASIQAEGAREVELSGKRIYPGLIAAATAAGLIEIDAVRATLDAREVGEYTPDVRSWMAVNPDSELLPVRSRAPTASRTSCPCLPAESCPVCPGWLRCTAGPLRKWPSKRQ
jgi:hypothetical protein